MVLLCCNRRQTGAYLQGEPLERSVPSAALSDEMRGDLPQTRIKNGTARIGTDSESRKYSVIKVKEDQLRFCVNEHSMANEFLLYSYSSAS